MSIDPWQLVRFLHVVGAVLWAGPAIFGFLVLMPAVKAAGPAGQAFMKAVEQRGGFGRYMMPMALITILSGVAIYWEQGYLSDSFASIATGMVTIGGIAGILVLLLGFAYSMPQQRRMKALSAAFGSQGPTPEQQAEMARIGGSLMKAGVVSTALIALALVLMVGRFVVT
jgi:uncharacterized membrane protein